MGRFAKRFSGERPISLGFELTFLSEFKRVVWRVLDRAAKRRACISQAPVKVPFEIFATDCYPLWFYFLNYGGANSKFTILNGKFAIIKECFFFTEQQ